jgi:hypothetical protein
MTKRATWSRSSQGGLHTTNGFDVLDPRLMSARISREDGQHVLRVWISGHYLTPAVTVCLGHQAPLRAAADRFLTLSKTWEGATAPWTVDRIVQQAVTEVISEESARIRAEYDAATNVSASTCCPDGAAIVEATA